MENSAFWVIKTNASNELPYVKKLVKAPQLRVDKNFENVQYKEGIQNLKA